MPTRVLLAKAQRPSTRRLGGRRLLRAITAPLNGTPAQMMSSSRLVPLLTLALLWTASSNSLGTVTTQWANEQMQFDVFLDKRRIGSHEVLIERTENSYQVTTKADFEVKVLFFNAYQYEHSNVETWQNGCLTRIDARTNDNGTELSVRGRQDAQGFWLETDSGRHQHGPCVRSFAYWDLQALDSQRLLNSQTGELLQARLGSPQPGTLDLAGTSLSVTRYALAATANDIELTYGPNGSWLELKTEVEGGRTLRYRRRDIADAVAPH